MSRCIALIDSKALLNNLSYLKEVSRGAKILVMVKANAYGHGLREVASIIKEIPDISFGVAALEEAINLRNIHIHNPIFLFDGGASCDEVDAWVDYDITPLITEYRSLKRLAEVLQKQNKNKKIHLKIDTGFTRLGLDFRSLLQGNYDEMLDLLKNGPFQLEGVATHFCSADAPNNVYTKQQLLNFREALNYLIKRQLNFTALHMANSAGILRNNYYLPEFLDKKELLIRPGLAAYGINPVDEPHPRLKPVMTIIAQVIAIKNVERGQSVGYGQNFVAKTPMTVAIISMGYGDGLRRSLNKDNYFLYRGERLPLVGVISMDSCAVDITKLLKKYGEASIRLGDFVNVLGEDGGESRSAKDWAQIDGTIPYEILTSIARLTRRII